ncbi:MAG: hypothetical protein AB7I38_16005 [Dehalococcoidia bacterium]
MARSDWPDGGHRLDLAEEDATGQGRALLWDRNWVVVAAESGG